MTDVQHAKTRQNILRVSISAAVLLSACSSEEGEKSELTVDAAIPPAPLLTLVANQASNNISAFMINAATGVLVPVAGSPYPAGGTTPGGIAVSSDGAFLYVANQGTNNIPTFTVVPGTGALTPVGPPVPAGTTPTSVTVSPDGAFLYAANQGSNDVFAYKINGVSGALATASGSPFPDGVTPRAIATAGRP